MKLNRDLKILSAALFLWAAGEGLFIFTLPLYMGSLGADSKQIGLLYSLNSTALVLATVPAGLAADRWGPRSGITSGWVLGAVAGALMAFAPGLALFGVGWVLYGFTGWVLPPISAYITRARGELAPERALAGVFSTFSAGYIISPALGGYIGRAFGLQTNYVIAAVFFVLSCVLVFGIKRQPPHPAEDRPHPAELLTNRHAMSFAALIFGVMTISYLGFHLAPKFLSDVKHLNPEQIGWLGSVNALGGFLLNQYLGRRPPRRGFILTLALILAYGLILLRANWAGWFVLAYFLRGAYFTVRVQVGALVTRIVSSSQLGAAFALYEVVITGANILAPYLAGDWYKRFSPAAPFQIMIGLIPVAALLMWFFAPRQATAPVLGPVTTSDKVAG
jgi:predicted MFS family arabinose efflux permease